MSEKDIEVLKRDVQKILSYLHNDEGTGEKGLVAEFADHKIQFNKFVINYNNEQIEKKVKQGIYGAIGGGALAILIFIGEKTVQWFMEHIK